MVVLDLDRQATAASGQAGRGGGLSPRPMAGHLIRWAGDWVPALPLITLALLLLVAPAVALIGQSLTDSQGALTLANWTKALGSAVVQQAIGHSLTLAATVATLVTVIGAPLTLIIARLPAARRAAGIGFLNVATNLSGIGLGFAYVASLGSYGMITLGLQGLGIDLTPPPQGSFTGLLLAYLYSNLPMFVLLTLPAMAVLKSEWQDAAATAGATPLQFWRHIGGPVLRPFLLANWLLIFTWSVGLYGLPVALIGTSPGSWRLITVEMSKTLLGSLFGGRTMPVYAVVLMILAVISLTGHRLIVTRGTRWLA